MAKLHTFEVWNDRFYPREVTDVRKGDTIIFTRKGDRVVGVEVFAVSINNASRTREGADTLFGAFTLGLSATMAEATSLVTLTLPEKTEHTYYLDIVLAPAPLMKSKSMGRGETDPAERGTITVVGGSGPNPFPPEKDKRADKPAVTAS